MTNTYLKNSDALMDSHEEALTICHDILEGNDAAREIKDKVVRLSDRLFEAVKRLCKSEGISVEEAFNNLAFMMGYNYNGDTETGAPDLGGSYIKREGGAWPKGTLSTYRAQMGKFDKEHGGIEKAPTFTELKKTVNPKKSDPLLEAIKEVRANKELSDAEKQCIEVDMLNTLKDYLQRVVADKKDAAKRAQGPKQAPKAKAAPKAPKSHAKKKAA